MTRDEAIPVLDNIVVATVTSRVRGLESAVVSALFKRKPQAFAAAVPELVEMVARAYV